MRSIKKIEPFIENVIIGLLFIALGFHILKSFNHNFFGIVGMIAMLWGGFRILLGLIIYGIAIWALIFKPESFTDFKQKQSFKRVLKKVDKDINDKKFKRAQDRLHGLISTYPNNLMVKFRLSAIYLMQNDFINAGRYVYLKRYPSEKERLSIERFERSLGNNAFQILMKITRPSKIDIEFVTGSKRKITELVERVRIDSERDSWVIDEYAHQLEHLDRPFYDKLLVNYKDILVHLLILAVLLLVTEIFRR